jgi:hypothetical protein
MSGEFLKAVLLLIAEVLLIVILYPSDWASSSVHKEREMLHAHFTPKAAKQIDDRALHYHDEWFIESGFADGLFNMFVPSEQQVERSRGMEELGKGWFRLVESRIQVMLDMLQQLMIRLSMTWQWWPFVVCLVVPAIFDGYMTRRIKKNNFDYASPMIHKLAMQSMIWVVIGLPIIYLLPIPLPPWIVPTLLLLAAAATGFALGNFYKRI